MLQARPGYREINYNGNDFIWNEVMLWLVKQMSESPLNFMSTKFENSDVIDYDSPGKICFRSERTNERYSGNRHVKFFINRDLITEYKLIDCHFNHRNYFATALKDGSYKNYSIEGEQINKVWIPCGFKNYTNLRVKRKVWKAVIDKGRHLTQDITIQKIEWDGIYPNYDHIKRLGASIIERLKRNQVFKSFIKGEDINSYKARIAKQKIKSALSVDSIVGLFEAIQPERVNAHYNNSGPWATTGTDHYVERFDISQLLKTHSDAESFIKVNIAEIFKGLQKKRYSHPLGYYTLKGCEPNIRNKIDLELSCTTYYN